MADDLFAPPTSEELTPTNTSVQTPQPQAAAPKPVKGEQANLYAPPTEDENKDLFAPPSPEELAPQTPEMGHFSTSDGSMTSAADQKKNLKAPDTSMMGDYITKNIQAYQASSEYKIRNPEQHPAKDFWESLKAGFQNSTLGLDWRSKMPDTTLPPDAEMMMRIGGQIGQMAGDLPDMIAGGAIGGVAGGVAGGAEGSVVPVAGTIIGAGVGAAVGAGAGAFAVPNAVRKMLMDHYERGDITTPGEFAHRMMSTSWEAIKGAAVGAATAVSGGVGSAVGGAATKFAAELTTMTTMGKALEGHLPAWQDFVDGAIVIGGWHGSIEGSKLLKTKLRNIYAATGEAPAQVAHAASLDVELKQNLLSNDPNSPPQAQPTKLTHSSEGSITLPPLEDQAKTIEKAKQMANESGKSVLIPSEEGPPQEVHPDPEHQWKQTPLEPKEKYFPPNLTEDEKVLAAKIGTKPEMGGPSLSERADKWRQDIIDKFDSLKKAEEAIEAKTGKEIPASESAYVGARLHASFNDTLSSILEHGPQDEKGKFTSEGVNAVYKEIPKDRQASFDLYGVAKRALELNSRGIESGMPLETADRIVEAGRKEFEALNQRRVKARNAILDYGVAGGVLDPVKVENSKTLNQDYIDYQRLIPQEELDGGDIGAGKLLHKIEGSTKDLIDPRQTGYEAIAAIVRRVEINDIRMKALNNLTYTDENGSKANDFVKEVPLARGGALKANQIAIFRDGKMSALEGTPLVIDSLKRLEGDKTSMGIITTIAAKFGQMARVGNILDPGFGVRHVFRSGLMSFVYTKTGQIPFYHSAIAMSEFMKGDSESYKNFIYDGAAVAGLDGLEENYISNHLQEADSKYPFRDKVWNIIKTPFEATHAFVKASDNLTRFVEYKRAIEQGKSRDEAAFLAREVTPDFAKSGLQRSALRAATAFQGAHINSLDRMYQGFKEDTGGTILRMSALAGISAMVYMVNKGDKDIQDLPDYVRDLYWPFKIPGTQMIFKVPKPWGPGILFGSGTERTLDAFFKKNPHAYDGFAKSLIDSVIPPMLPNIIAPALDQYANKNAFTGQQLVNDTEQKGLPELMYQPYTSETAKAIAKVIGHVPKVKDIGPSSDPLASPAVVENYIRAWSGTLGGIALKLSDAGIKSYRIAHAPDQATADRIEHTGKDSVESSIAEAPILNEFMTRFPSVKSQPITNFYENYDDAMRIHNSIRAAAKQGDFDAAQRFQKMDPGYEGLLKSVNDTLSNGRKVIKGIQNNDSVSSPTQKRQLIDTILFQMNSAAKMGNQMIDKAKEN